MADAARSHGVDPDEMIRAASSKPYGYTPFTPGLGVGGVVGLFGDPECVGLGLRVFQGKGIAAGHAGADLCLEHGPERAIGGEREHLAQGVVGINVSCIVGYLPKSYEYPSFRYIGY